MGKGGSVSVKGGKEWPKTRRGIPAPGPGRSSSRPASWDGVSRSNCTAGRVVQASLKLGLEPIFEADFKPCSYGFRPNRRAHDAIAEIHHLASEPINYRWVFEADIKACFDEISHSALMDRLRARIKDK